MNIKYNLFPKGKQHCLTMSFDDGRNYDRKMIELFNQYQIKGTFHLNSGKLDEVGYVSKDEVKQLYDGHEVACHTVNHPHLTELPTTQIIEEVLKDKETLESLVEYPIRGISVPFGAYNQEILNTLKLCGMEYNRTVIRTYKFDAPNNFLEWHPTHHLREFDQQLFDDFFNNPFNQMKILYLWGHSYEFEDLNLWHDLEKTCAYLGNKDTIWYATNIQLKDYLCALKRLVVSANGTMFYNPSGIDVWISVENKKVCIPANQTIHLFTK